MFARKSSFWKIIGAIVVLLAIGVVMLLNFLNQSTLDLVNNPAMNLLPKNSEFYKSLLFREMAKETARLPLPITTEIMRENGIFSILHGTISKETSSFFDTFLANSSNGEAAQILITVYTADGYPVLMNVLFDQFQYLALIDKTDARLNSKDEENEYLRYDYLKIIISPETGSKFVILTNDNNLTFEQLRTAQIGSDMDSIDAFQLFSYSE